MPSFNPLGGLGGITGRTSATLFEIRYTPLSGLWLSATNTRRLENEFVVLRGGESEAADQLLKGTVVLCLQSPLKVDDVHLKMTGTMKIG
jgi:hypothetical protein